MCPWPSVSRKTIFIHLTPQNSLMMMISSLDDECFLKVVVLTVVGSRSIFERVKEDNEQSCGDEECTHKV